VAALAFMTAKFGASRQRGSHVPCFAAYDASDFTSAALTRNNDHVGLLRMFLCVAGGAKDLNISRGISQLWMVCIREFVMTMQVIGGSTSLAHTYFSHTLLRYKFHFVRPSSYSAFPVNMICTSWCSSYARALSAAIFHGAGPMLCSLKAVSTIFAGTVKDRGRLS